MSGAGNLKPFPKGKSGNPSGQPKWLRKVRKQLGAGCPKALAVLQQVMEEGEEKNRVLAAKTWLEFTLPKPKADADVAPVKLDEAPRIRPDLAAKLAALDS